MNSMMNPMGMQTGMDQYLQQLRAAGASEQQVLQALQHGVVPPGMGLPPGMDASTMAMQQAGMQQQHAAMYHQHQMYQMQQAGMVSGMPGMMGVSDTLSNSHAV